MRRIGPFIFFILLVQSNVAQIIHEVEPVIMGAMNEDYAPTLLDSGFVMCSIRESDATIAFKDAETGKPLSDLYWVPWKGGVFGTPVLFSVNLTTPVNEGPATFSPDGRTICYTRNQVLPKKLSNLRSADQHLGLYFSTLQEEVWSEPQAFPYNTKSHSVMHPCFSRDGETLYFASDMPGSEGGVDLYRCHRIPEGWSEPENLGPAVNGPGNEMFPSIGHDGTLYFSSDRAGGPGKYDLFETRLDGVSWETPTPLPEPLNSTANDLCITFHKDGLAGLISSDRNGTDHIYRFKRTVPKFRDCTAQQPNNYCYSFKSRPHAATNSIPVEHIWELGDGTTVKGSRADHCYPEPGTYTVRSLLVDRQTGNVFHELKSHELVIKDLQQAWISAPDTVRTGRTLALDGNNSRLDELAPAEYHWDMGDGTRQAGITAQHTFRTPGTFEVRLDILGTPTEDGAIGNVCNTKTIVVIDRFKDHEDMTVIATYQDALGKTHSFEYQEMPFDAFSLALDENSDALFAVELFASKERVDLDDPRFVQVKKLYRVVEHFDPERGLYTYSVGETNDLEALYEVFKKVKELQFMDAEVHLLKEEKLVDLSQLDLRSIEELDHSKFSTTAILFDYNSDVLDPGSDPVLQKVTGLLRQHPELQLVIEAHTDDVGGRSFNMDLSQRRAHAVQTFLEVHGVESDRLIPIGHGKNQPIASNRTEEGRHQNRRVEFRMRVAGQEQAFEKTR